MKNRIQRYLLLLLFILVLSPVSYSTEESLTPTEEDFSLGDYDKFLLGNLKLAEESPQDAFLPLLLASDISKQFLSQTDLGTKELRDLSKNPNLPPLARSIAKEMLASIYAASGREYQATEIRRNRGVIPAWRIAGAFGEYQNASFYQSFPPEGEVDFSIFMNGLGKDVTWRLLSEDVCLNNFVPYKWVSPQRGVIYLYTQFELKAEEEIVLERDGASAFSFWVDGIECGGADYMQEETGQVVRLSSGRKLSAGWHRLLIKMYSSNTSSPEIFRLLTTDLKPIPEISYNIKKLHGQNEFGKKLWTKVTPDLSGYSKAEQALYYQYSKLFDKALVAWQEAIAETPDNAAIRIYYAACAGQAGDILPGPVRASIVQREAIRALSLDPYAVAALLLLGEHERQNGRYQEADKYYSKALKINPEAIMIHGARIRMALHNGWKGETATWLKEYRAIYPDSYLLYLLEGIRYNNIGHVRKAADNLNLALKLDQDNLVIATDCIKSYFASGETEKALSTWQSLPSYEKDRVDMLMLYSEILSRMNEPEKAVAALKSAASAVGTDAGIKRTEGDVLFAAKNDDAAKELYTKSLALDSGNYSLRRLLSSLNGEDYHFWKSYLIDPKEKIDEFIKSDKQIRGNTARLIDQTVLTLYDGGGYSNYTHELQSVLTDGGVGKAAIVDTYGELLQARTMLPERGISLEPVILHGSRDITMPAVTPGAVVEHTYLNESATPVDRKLRFPKWYFRSPNSEESFLFSQYVVRVPKGVAFAYATRNLGEKVEFSLSEDEDGTKEFVWTGIDMPEAIHEEGSPAIGSTLPYVAIASKQSWDDVHKSMISTYLGKIIPSTSIIKKAEELTKGMTSTNDKITAIYEFVNKEIMPTSSRAPASHVYLQRAGNRRNLLLSMLKAINIEAELIAARPPENIMYDPIWKLPTDSNFIDYLIRAEGDDGEYIWLDPRARYAGAGEIGEDFCGGTGFVLGLYKGEFITIPDAPAKMYTVERSREYSLTNGGVTKIDGIIEYSGTRGWEFKDNFVDLPDELRLGVLEDTLSGSLFGVSIDSYTLPNLTISGTNFTVDYTAHIDNFLRENTGGAYGIPFALPQISMLPKQNANNRRTPYHLSNFLAGHDKYTFSLPEGAVVKELPQDYVIRSQFGFYTLLFSLEDEKIVLERKYSFKPQTVSLSSWKDYYNLASDIKQIENNHIWFEK